MSKNMLLRNHQICAIGAFENHYYNNDNSKGIISMCCGSGKTYTFYNITKKCIEKGERLFIYVTSRILLVQGIIKDIIKWIYNDKLDIIIIVKVSDFSYRAIKDELLREIFNKHKTKDIPEYKLLEQYLKKLESNIKCEGDIETLLKSEYLYSNKKVLIVTTYNSSSKIVDGISNYNKSINTNKDQDDGCDIDDENIDDENIYDENIGDIDDNINNSDNDNDITIQQNSNVTQKPIHPDLLVLDEAHNLASTEDISRAKKILTDKEINCFTPSKYLFMTATPLKIIKRDNTSNYVDDEITFSMDNERLYGKVFYEYTFYNGIRDNYITDFDVVHLDDNDIIDPNVNKNLQNIKDLDNTMQQHIYFTSVIELLIIAIKKYSLKHTIIYLENCEKVSLFENIINKSENFKNIEMYKVTSRESARHNKTMMRNFSTKKLMPTILLAVDMLNEGVDIPECDSILFMEERNSETIIVQNIGRALRITDSKEKAYVIIPTKIYSLEEKSYSSKYKKIREVCDILKEPPADIKVPYKRYAKGAGAHFRNNNQDPDVENKSGLVDKIDNINESDNDINNTIMKKHNDINSLTDDDVKKINDYSNIIVCNHSIKNRNNNFSNFTLDELKREVQRMKIDNLIDLKKVIEKKIVDIPHKYYKGGEWKCYGDLLFNKIYSYEESMNIIKELNLSDVNSPREWQEFYNNIIETAYNGDHTNYHIVNKIMHIPHDPKKYYLDKWDNDTNNGWTTFLGKRLDELTGLQINSNPSDTHNSQKNIQNIINNDKLKVTKLIPDKWLTFKHLNTNLSELKKFIDLKFNIDSKLTTRYKLDANLKVGIKMILVNIANVNNHPPIIIGDDYKIKFDQDIFDKQKIIKKKDINRNKYEYISSGILQNIIDEFSDEIDNFVRMNKNKK